MSSAVPERVFLITGGSGGIGAAIAREAVGRGHSVVLAARRPEPLHRLVGKLGELGGKALAVVCDVTDPMSQQRAVADALAAFGRIDVAIASAGVELGSPLVGGADTFDQWSEMVLTNVYGVAVTIRASADALRETGGDLVLIGSVTGRVAIPGDLYSATKWAIAGMAESIRRQLSGAGVRVLLVEPGRVDTPLQHGGRDLPMLEPEQVARAVMFAVEQPREVAVNELVIRPSGQEV